MDNTLARYLQVSQHLSQHFREHFGKLNLTFPQALTLNVLGKEGPMPISRLAEKTGSANSTISGIVDRLEKLDLAKRTRSDLDHRVIQVEVTEKYRTLRGQVDTGVSEYFDDLLGALSEKERQAIAQGLENLEKALVMEENARKAEEKK